MNEVIKTTIADAIQTSISADRVVVASVSNSQFSTESILDEISEALPANTDYWDREYGPDGLTNFVHGTLDNGDDFKIEVQ